MMTHDYTSFPSAVHATSKEAWLTARQQYVTASDVGTLFGANNYKARAAMVASKREAPGPSFENSAMRAGQFLEEGIIRWWADDLRITHERLDLHEPLVAMCRDDSVSVLVAHPTTGIRLAASPDAVCWDTEDWKGPPSLLVEAKAHGPRSWRDGECENLFEACDNRGLPEPLVDERRCWATVMQYLQVQTQMLCTGIDRACVVRCWGTERRDTYIPACPELHGMIVSKVHEFWAEVDKA